MVKKRSAISADVIDDHFIRFASFSCRNLRVHEDADAAVPLAAGEAYLVGVRRERRVFGGQQ